MRYIEKEFRFLFLAMLVNFVLFGVSLTIIGATLPKIIGDFNWSYTATGTVLSAGSIGYFASSIISGILLQRLGPKLVIVIGLAFQFAGLLFFASRPIVLLNLLLNFLIGFGQGGTEVVVNFSVVRIERNGQSRLMNLMHTAFSIGAVVGPYAVIALINTGLGWQAIYRLMALLSLLIAVVFSLLPFSRLREEGKEQKAIKARVTDLLLHPLIILSSDTVHICWFGIRCLKLDLRILRESLSDVRLLRSFYGFRLLDRVIVRKTFDIHGLSRVSPS